MNLKNRQFIALLAALCWIFAQNISLDHQFTSEHLSQSESHICLSFANDNDDILVANSPTIELIKQQSSNIAQQQIVLGSPAQLGFQARAPPSLLS
jgi:hypothetical protein